MVIVSTLHDPQALFLDLIKRTEKELLQLPGFYLVHTRQTNSQLIDLLQAFKFRLLTDGLWGESRLAGLKQAIKNGEEDFFFCDFDKLLHWLAVEKQELFGLLKEKTESDFVAYGRSLSVFATYPRSWQVTEKATNRLVSRVLGLRIDVLTGVWRFNQQVGGVIIKKANEKSWGACVEWPLLANNSGFSIGYREARGLTFEDQDCFQREIELAGGEAKWKKLIYDSLAEWEKRTASMLSQIQAISRLERTKT